MGVQLDKESNDNIAKFKNNQSGKISTAGSKFDILVVPTDEEYMILKDTYNISQMAMNNGYSRKKKPNN